MYIGNSAIGVPGRGLRTERLTFFHGKTAGVSVTDVGVTRHSDRHQIEFRMATLLRVRRQLTGHRLMPRSHTIWEVSSFSHAFKRSTGKTPRAVRARAARAAYQPPVALRRSSPGPTRAMSISTGMSSSRNDSDLP
jgi:hypothetical protein